MAVSCQSVEETVSGILARRPVLSPVLQAFAPLLAARAALPAQLKPLLEAAGVRLPAMQRERAAQGRDGPVRCWRRCRLPESGQPSGLRPRP